MDTKDRKVITSHRRHHPKLGIERLYIKRENVGSGLFQQQLTVKTTTIGLKKYLYITTDWIRQLINTCEAKERNILLIKKVIGFLNNSTTRRNE